MQDNIQKKGIKYSPQVTVCKNLYDGHPPNLKLLGGHHKSANSISLMGFFTADILIMPFNIWSFFCLFYRVFCILRTDVSEGLICRDGSPETIVTEPEMCGGERNCLRDIQYPTGWKNNSEAKRNSHNTSASTRQLKIKLPKRASMHIPLVLSPLKTLHGESSLRGFCTCCDCMLPPTSGETFPNQVTFSTFTMNFPTSNKMFK